MPRSVCSPWSGLVIAAACSLIAQAVEAQSLRVELRDSTTAAPISGVLVAAHDSTGQQRADGLSTEGGVVVLTLRAAGTYTIRLRRIGLRPKQIAGVVVAAGPVQVLSVKLSSVRQTLSAVRVYAKSTCGRAPEGEDRTGALWEQVSLALRAATITQREGVGLPPLRVIERTNELSPTLEALSSIETRNVQGFGRLVQAADPDSLATLGYVRTNGDGGMSYFAPDETVLLSEAFLATHCFVVPKRDADAQLAELRFKPVRGRRVADIEGTAFVDIASGELRQISYRYVAKESLMPVKARHAGGDVFLRRLPNGAWIVDRWSIRMPLLRQSPTTGELFLTGYREAAGTVQEMKSKPPIPQSPLP